MKNRSARRGAVLIAAKERLSRCCGREIVARIERLVAEEIVHAAVPMIGAAARAQVNHAAIETAKFGRHVVGLDIDLLNVVDDREEDHLAGFRLQGGNAVE